MRVYVYRRAAETAQVPKPAEISTALGRAQPEVEDAIRRLAADRVWFLAPGTANIWAANPFCAVPSNFGCMPWGAPTGVSVSGMPRRCPPPCTLMRRSPPAGDCDEELALDVRDGALAHGEGVIHFAVPAVRWWENIAFT